MASSKVEKTPFVFFNAVFIQVMSNGNPRKSIKLTPVWETKNYLRKKFQFEFTKLREASETIVKS